MAQHTYRDRNKDEELHHSAGERESPSAAIVFEAIRHEGEGELNRPSAQLAWSGLAAGLAMGFSFLTEGLLAHYLPDAQWSTIISKFGYSIGFLIVVLGRQQLFTETPVIAVLPVLNARRLHYLMQMLRLWGVVLVTNMVGTFIFAWVLFSTDLMGAAEHIKFKELSEKPFADSFGTTLLGAIFAGWLIALMVWLLPFAETARVMVIVVLTYIIGLAGFPHIVAGAVEAYYGVMAGVAGWSEALLRFFLPALLGNVLGGVVLVAALNYGQVAAPRRKREAKELTNGD